jgi:hypothetical protein
MPAIYDKRVLLGVVRQMEKPRTFLRDTFFTQVRTSPTEKIEIDIVRGNRKVAPFVHPVIGGKVMKNQGFETKDYKPPLVAPEKVIRASDLQSRNAGENPYELYSPEEREAQKTAEYLQEMEDMNTRREELMCAQAIFEGVIHIVGDDLNEVIDFGFENHIELTKKWSDASSDKLADLEAAYYHGQKTGFVNPGICIMDNKVANLFISDEKMLKILDNKSIELAKIAPKNLPNGATYIGRIAKLDMDIYVYNAWYTDDWTDPQNPVEKPLVPVGVFALLPINADYTMAYGAVEVIDESSGKIYLAEGTRIPDVYVERKPARKVINLSTRPLPIPNKLDSWVVVQAL